MFILPIIMKALPIYLRVYKKVTLSREKYCLGKELRQWQSIKEKLLNVGAKGYKTKIEDLGLSQKKLEILKKMQQKTREVVIAEIDQDGFLLSNFGPIRNTPTISKEQFLARKRSNLKVVSINGYVGVKKDYLGNKLSFVRELRALHSLGLAGSNVPSIIDVDFDNLTLTFSYILGPILREELAKRGAVLRDRDVDSNPNYTYLNSKERWAKRLQEGKRVLYDVIDSQFVKSLAYELRKVHASGFMLNDIKYGNIVIEKRSGKPYLLDFELSTHYSKSKNIYFRILSDEDIEKFNLHFNTQLLTYKSINKNKNIPTSSSGNVRGSRLS